MILFLLFGLISSEFQKEQTYSVSIKSKYASIQTIDNFLYFLSKYSLSNLHQFLLKLFSNPNKSTIINDCSSLSTILLENQFLSNSSLGLLHSYIDINYYLPYGEMIRSIATQIDANSKETIQNEGFFLASDKNFVPANFKFYQTNITNKLENDILLNEENPQKINYFIYADLSNSKSQEFILNILTNQNSELTNKFNVILRPISFSASNSYLHGYGVEMKPFESTLKLDDDDEKVKISTTNPKHDSTTDFANEDISSDYFNYSEIPFIGTRFIQFIMNQKQINENTTLIKLLRDISNNLPVFIRQISETGFSTATQDEYDRFSSLLEQLQRNRAIFTVNGRISNVNDFDAFSLLNMIQEESIFADILDQEFNISKDVVFNKNYLMDDDFYLDYRDDHIIWNTDFEDPNDPRYIDWSTQLSNPFKLKKNLLNYVLYIDLTNTKQLSSMYKLYALSQLPYHQKLFKQNINQIMPIRFGILPFFNLGNKLSRRVSFAYAHLALHNPNSAIEFLANAYGSWFAKSKKSPNEQFTEAYFVDAYSQLTDSNLLGWNDLYKLYAQDSNEYKFIKSSNEHFKSIGVSLGSMMLNGKQVSLSDDIQEFIKQTQQMLIAITQICQKERYDDLVNIDLIDDILAKQFMFVHSFDKSTTYQRFAREPIFGTTYSNQIKFINSMKSIEWNYKDDNKPRSYFVLFTNNSQNDTELGNEIFEDFAKNEDHAASTAFAVNPKDLREFLKIKENETVLFTNGLLYKSLSLTNVSQLHLIDKWSNRFILSYLEEYSNKADISFESLLYLTSIVVDWKRIPIQRLDLNQLIERIDNIDESPLYYNDKNKGIEMILLIDPFTKEFQKISEFFYYTSNVQRFINLKLLLIPPNSLENYDIETYYRYSINSDEVVFSMLNDSTSYFTQINTPSSWNIETLSTTPGLDVTNVHFEEYSSDEEKFNVFAEYLLRSIVIEGRCIIDIATAPTLLELGLYTQKWTGNDFTTVKVDEAYAMPTLSYYQFNADPGLYSISPSTESSNEIYKLNDNKAKSVEIGSFVKKDYILHGSTHFANSDDYINYLKQKVVESTKMNNFSNSTNNNINIFTIPNGYNHEKLAKIMFLSVLRNTQSHVTFYMPRSFLSPTFKASLQRMSKDFHFDYKLIDFKWPSWLHKETDPQRIVMAEKILFLDQLFPLNVDKIIYVDTDQIVRADLQELMSLKFTGNAPYAFPPYCNSRPEMDPYRFWEHGYWNELLAKKKGASGEPLKYHSSSIFAVDLVRLKQFAFAEFLRANYQQLSSIKNNLANLDQDLPNLLQDKIPIHTLNNNWFWCDAWCANEEMQQAKTIDFCANPMTNENTLHDTHEKIEEWSELNEITEKLDSQFENDD